MRYLALIQILFVCSPFNLAFAQSEPGFWDSVFESKQTRYRRERQEADERRRLEDQRRRREEDERRRARRLEAEKKKAREAKRRAEAPKNPVRSEPTPVYSTPGDVPKNLPAIIPKPETQADNQWAAVNVELFVATQCPDCERLESYLSELDVPFQKRELLPGSRTEEEYMQTIGRGIIPVVRVNGKLVRGYEPDAIRKLILSEKKGSGPYDRQY